MNLRTITAGVLACRGAGRSSLVIMVVLATFVLWSAEAAATMNYKIEWLGMSTVAPGSPVPSGSMFNLPFGYGNVEITYTVPTPSVPPNWEHTRGLNAAAQNRTISYLGDTYSWTTIDMLDQVNYSGGMSTPVQYTVTYTFAPPLPAGKLVLGVGGLGRMDQYYSDPQFISKITVANNSRAFLGDCSLGPAGGPTQFDPFASYFELYNSLPGNGVPGDPSFNTHLGLVRIDDPVSVLTLDVYHIGQDGFSFTVGFLCPVDLWMKDYGCDDGTEPQKCPLFAPMWRSDDIRVTHSPTADPWLAGWPHENPVTEWNFVYVRVRNHECGPIQGELGLYWAYAATAYKWDPGAGNWDNSPVTGDNIGWVLVDVPVYPPGEWIVKEFQWYPPKEGNYSLLARFISGDDPMYVPEGTKSRRNIFNNNNIVGKNVIVVKYTGLPKSFLIRNVEDFAANIDLEFNAAGGDSGIPFLDGGSVRAVLAPELFGKWMGAGGLGQGIIVNPNDSSISLTSTLAKIQGIPMEADEAQPVTMYFTPDDASPLPTFQSFVVSQFSNGQTEPDGELTFEFRLGGETQIPTLTEWGMIIFVVLLAGWMAVVVVRRWKASHAAA